MDFILDTNICIYAIKKKSQGLLGIISQYIPEKIGLTTITVSELHFGVVKSAYPEKNLDALQQFLTPFQLIDFDHNAALAYATIRFDLERKGTPIGNMDMLIAACTLSRDLTLVTNNTKEFSRVVGLKIENWV
jgi:tRNA(fMet)-specific endonuclease VapC